MTDKFAVLLDRRKLIDGRLAESAKNLHYEGKAPSSINIVIAAVNWVSKSAGLPHASRTSTTDAFKVFVDWVERDHDTQRSPAQ